MIIRRKYILKKKKHKKCKKRKEQDETRKTGQFSSKGYPDNCQEKEARKGLE